MGRDEPKADALVSSYEVNGGVDTGVVFWNIESKLPQKFSLDRLAGDYHLLGFSRDSRLLFTANRAGIIRLWDARADRARQAIETMDLNDELAAVSFRSGAELVAVTRGGRISVWDTGRGR